MRLRRLLALAPALVLPLALIGAKPSKRETPAEAPPGSTTASETMNAILDSTSVATTMTVESAGAEPRRVVAFTPRPGEVTTTEMTQQMSGSMSVNGQTMAIPATGMVTTTRTSIGEPDASGNIRVRNEVLGMRPTGGAPAPMADVAGLVTELVVSPAGRLVGVEVSGGADPAVAEMAGQVAEQTLRNLQSFPTEPIGVGARWTTSLDVGMAGMSFLADVTSTVTSVSNDHLDVEIAMTMKPGATQMQFPGLPPGASMEMAKLVGTTTGTQRIDLDRLVSTFDQKTVLDLDLALSMPEGTPGATGPMTMSMHMDMTMTSTPVETE